MNTDKTALKTDEIILRDEDDNYDEIFGPNPADKEIRLVKEKDDDFVADEPRAHIPEGTYTVICLGGKEGLYFNSTKLFLKFIVLNPETYEGIELPMYINLTYSGTSQPFKKVPSSSKYFSQWVIANNNERPNRQDKMSSRIFKDGIFEAVVTTVKPKFPDKTEQPESLHYSKIDYLKKRIK